MVKFPKLPPILVQQHTKCVHNHVMNNTVNTAKHFINTAIDELRVFTSGHLRDLLTSKDLELGNCIPISTALILFDGLPMKIKEKIVNELLQKCINHQQKPHQHIYQVAVTQLSNRQDCDWFEHSPCSLPRLALAAGIRFQHVFATKDGRIPFIFHPDQFRAFDNQNLQRNFAEIAYELQSQEVFQKCSGRVKDPAAYWKKALRNGFRLMNIWDIQLNRAVLHSLSAIAGVLHESHSYLFIDLQEDVPCLSLPPAIPKEQKRSGDDFLTKFHSRLEHLVRSAIVAKSIDEDKRDACTIVAVHNGESEEELLKSRCTILQEALLKEAKKMKVDKLIDQDLLVLDYSSPDYIMHLKQHIEKSLTKMKSKEKFLPSWLFLLATLMSSGDVFLKENELTEMARECKIVGDEVKQMLTRFTAFGSVISFPDIKDLSDIIILQPQAFTDNLSKLYYPTENEETGLHRMYGILTKEEAQRILGDSANTYLQILRSAQISMSLHCNEVQRVLETAASSVDYIPSVRVNQPQSGCDPKSLHLLIKHDFAPINTHVALASCIRDRLKKKDFEVSLIPVKESNVTRFEIKSGEASATLSLIYQGEMYEIQLQMPRESCELLTNIHLEITQACVDATRKRKEHFAIIKIGFVVICPDCHNPTAKCDPAHLQCFIPVELQCEKCGNDLDDSSPFHEWKQAVEKVRIMLSVYFSVS